MDEDKYIEQYCEFYFRIHAKLKARKGVEPDPVDIAAILDNVGRSIRQDKIHQERLGVGGDKEKAKGPPASPKQLAFIKDLGGTATPGMTVEEASKYIEELKGR